jgi:hypothetical protein
MYKKTFLRIALLDIRLIFPGVRSTLQSLSLPGIILLFLFTPAFLSAQDKSNVKFGKISPADFDLSSQKIDSGAGAVVIADVGSSEFQGNNKGWFSLEFRHFRRVKILNRSGLEAADVRIPLYSEGNTVEKLEGLKAVTYNLENGKIVETRLDDKSVFTDKVSKHRIDKKFTFPAVKEGSIIEYSYTQLSDFIFNLQPWDFQGRYPCLWSEYEADIPNFFKYVVLSQGYLPFDKKTSSTRNVNFRITFANGAEKNETLPYDDEVVDHRWVMKNVPALKDETFTTTLANHIAKIEFQLSAYDFKGSIPSDKMGNWASVSESMMKDDDFGADLDRNNGWMDEDLKDITKGAGTQMEKAKKIYAYLQNNFTCTEHYGMKLDNPIKTTFKNKKGNAAAINLLLVAMLNHEHIPADPVILSTRDNGYTSEIYPLIGRFNYTICMARVDSSVCFLDASRPWMGFDRLPQECYNGHAQVVSKQMPVPVYFNADSFMERKTTIVFISNDGKGGLSVGVQTVPGYFESARIREKIHQKGEKDFFKEVQSGYAGGTEIANTSVDSLKLLDEPLKIGYDFTMHLDSTEDISYFNPLMAADIYKENPFQAAERKYPVEMPCASDNTYILNMEIPEGYTVDEVPKSTKLLYNEDEGFFEYIVAKDENTIQLRCRIKLGKANFAPEEYNVLRDFYTYVVKKQGEQIVFKKKK